MYDLDRWLAGGPLEDKPEITGQFIIRDACGGIEPREGHRTVFVMGVLALPKTSLWKGEHQYVVAGDGDTLKVFPESGVDLTDKLAGLRVDQVFTLSKLWRV